MRRVEFVWFDATCSWATAPSISLGRYNGSYEAAQAVKEFQATYAEAEDGEVGLWMVDSDGKECFECVVQTILKDQHREVG